MKNQTKIHVAIQAKGFEQVVNFYIDYNDEKIGQRQK